MYCKHYKKIGHTAYKDVKLFSFNLGKKLKLNNNSNNGCNSNRNSNSNYNDNNNNNEDKTFKGKCYICDRPHQKVDCSK